MIALRWALGIVTSLFLVAWIALVAFGNSYRRSFGASENGPLLTLAPLLLVTVLLAGLCWPEKRALLHTGAALAVLLLAASTWLLRQSAFGGTLGIFYAAAWLLFYTMSRGGSR
ncbi:MAG: hypothetical protein U0527_09950 [Candidatus Eisenbacteria bacterium]